MRDHVTFAFAFMMVYPDPGKMRSDDDFYLNIFRGPPPLPDRLAFFFFFFFFFWVCLFVSSRDWPVVLTPPSLSPMKLGQQHRRRGTRCVSDRHFRRGVYRRPRRDGGRPWQSVHDSVLSGEAAGRRKRGRAGLGASDNFGGLGLVGGCECGR